ncbi:MAG: riboflavin synthase [Acidobacteriaceae bacterium]|nr:riboflavin synthase [Acidobacteriaceae bacterium]
MFTGIVEELGHVIRFESGEAGAHLQIRCFSVLQDASVGSSIAVNGTCLTALEIKGNEWSSDIAPETLKRTNLGHLQPGSIVNLERPLRATSRLDGHFVLGHVDATGFVVSLEALGDGNWWLKVRVPAELTRYIVSKGSLAIDGISLTVAEMADNLVSIAVIPHTYQHTTLHARRAGSPVNIEVDILAKHLEKLIAQRSFG